MAQIFHHFPLFSKGHSLPTGAVLRIVVGVQSGFAGNSFIEAEHG